MLIKECTMTVHFPAVEDIRRKALDMEEQMNSSFDKPFAIVTIPDNAPVDYPRVIAKTNGGHSTLLITKSSAQIQTTFDNGYTKDFSRCVEYMIAKRDELFATACFLSGNGCYFSGVTMMLEFDEWEKTEEQIYSKIFNGKNKVPYDVQAKITHVVEDTYYINLEIQNARHYVGSELLHLPRLCELQNLGTNVAVQIDINDRYAYSFSKDYYTHKEQFDAIFDLLKKVVEDKIFNYLQTGEICFDDI